jgi:hypothetical protein
MLNIRANLLSGEEAVADRVMAKRVRERVVALCEERMAQKNIDEHDYWLVASYAEALAGLGRRVEAMAILSKATPTTWALETTMPGLARTRAEGASHRPKER